MDPSTGHAPRSHRHDHHSPFRESSSTPSPRGGRRIDSMIDANGACSRKEALALADTDAECRLLCESLMLGLVIMMRAGVPVRVTCVLCHEDFL